MDVEAAHEAQLRDLDAAVDEGQVLHGDPLALLACGARRREEEEEAARWSGVRRGEGSKFYMDNFRIRSNFDRNSCQFDWRQLQCLFPARSQCSSCQTTSPPPNDNPERAVRPEPVCTTRGGPSRKTTFSGKWNACRCVLLAVCSRPRIA